MQIEHKGDKLVITIDVSAASIEAAPVSSTGKSRLVASTGGFNKLVGGLGLNVVCTAPLPAPAK